MPRFHLNCRTKSPTALTTQFTYAPTLSEKRYGFRLLRTALSLPALSVRTVLCPLVFSFRQIFELAFIIAQKINLSTDFRAFHIVYYKKTVRYVFELLGHTLPVAVKIYSRRVYTHKIVKQILFWLLPYRQRCELFSLSPFSSKSS